MGSAGFLVNRTPKYSLVSKLLRIFNANYVSGFQVPFVGHMPYPHKLIQFSERFLKHGIKFSSVFGGYFVSMNILPRKEARYYAYSSRVGEKFMPSCSLTLSNMHNFSFLPLLRSRSKNLLNPPLPPCSYVNLS
jgi:hypothetical protein